MELKENEVVKSKHLDTDIDTICIFFNDINDAVVDEFEVPEKYLYSVIVCRAGNIHIPNWIEIVNPKELKNYSKDEWILPEVEGINFKDYVEEIINQLFD